MMQAQVELKNKILNIRGELSFATAMQLQTEAKPHLVDLEAWVFDFSAVTQADSAGVATLIQWYKCAKHLNKEIKFKNMPEQMLGIIHFCGLDKLLLTETV